MTILIKMITLVMILTIMLKNRPSIRIYILNLVVTSDRNILTGSWFCQSLWDLNWTHMQIVVPPDWSPIQASGWVETSQGNLDDRKDHKEMTIVVIREHPQHVFFPPSCLPSLWMSEACQRTLSSEREPCKPGQKFNWLFMIIHVCDCMC